MRVTFEFRLKLLVFGCLLKVVTNKMMEGRHDKLAQKKKGLGLGHVADVTSFVHDERRYCILILFKNNQNSSKTNLVKIKSRYSKYSRQYEEGQTWDLCGSKWAWHQTQLFVRHKIAKVLLKCNLLVNLKTTKANAKGLQLLHDLGAKTN